MLLSARANLTTEDNEGWTAFGFCGKEIAFGNCRNSIKGESESESCYWGRNQRNG